MKRKIGAIFCMLFSIVLMSLPNGVRMTWMAEPGRETTATLYAYFDPFPWGYGNMIPFFTAILSVVVTTLLLLCFKYPLEKAARALLAVIAVASPLPWLLFWSPTKVGVIIWSLHLLALALVFSLTWNRKAREATTDS